MEKGTEAIVTIATAIVGVALLAVLVSQKSQTSSVIGAFGSAFANALSAATAPVTGSAATPNVGGNSTFSLGNFGLSSSPFTH